jgi:hypothetical protein
LPDDLRARDATEHRVVRVVGPQAATVGPDLGRCAHELQNLRRVHRWAPQVLTRRCRAQARLLQGHSRTPISVPQSRMRTESSCSYPRSAQGAGSHRAETHTYSGGMNGPGGTQLGAGKVHSRASIVWTDLSHLS